MTKAFLGASVALGVIALAIPTATRVEAKMQGWVQTVLRWVSHREGQPASVNRNLDGNGLSYGVIQWTQKSGNLGVLLEAMRKADPDAFARTFGASAAKVIEVAKRGSLETVNGARLWEKPWVDRFVSAGQNPVFQAVQWQLAGNGEHFRGALTVADMLGIHTERAMALFFDRSVHQGAVGARRIAEKLVAYWKTAGRPTDAKALEAFAWLCAERYRRSTAPASPYFSEKSRQILWKKVGVEWHAVTGEFDLYTIVVKRTGDILRSSQLSDAPLATVVA